MLYKNTSNHLVSKSSKFKLINAVILSSLCGLGLSYILPLIAKDNFGAFAQNPVPSSSSGGAVSTPNNIPATNIPATTIPANNIPATNVPATTVTPTTVPVITPSNSTNDPNNTGVTNSVNNTTTSPTNSNVTNTVTPNTVPQTASPTNSNVTNTVIPNTVPQTTAPILPPITNTVPTSGSSGIAPILPPLPNTLLNNRNVNPNTSPNSNVINQNNVNTNQGNLLLNPPNSTNPTVINSVPNPAINNLSNSIALNPALENSGQNNQVNVQRTTPIFNPPAGQPLSAFPQTAPLVAVPFSAPDCYIQTSDGRILSLEQLCQP